MTTKGDILAGEAPSKDEIIATNEQKVAKCLHLFYQLYIEKNTCEVLINHYCLYRLKD